VQKDEAWSQRANTGGVRKRGPKQRPNEKRKRKKLNERGNRKERNGRKR
jgi:hypothetical protein